MIDYLGAPIEYDSESNGYCYSHSENNDTYELPGLWFSARELHSLVVLRTLLSNLGTGLLEEQLLPVANRVERLIEHKQLHLGEVASRIRIISVAGRKLGECFHTVAGATLQRRKVRLIYHSRSTNEHTERVVSPQRLVHYRDNWYLDAWDELRGALRTFSVDRILGATEQLDSAINVSERELDDYFVSAYGIFSGKANKIAVLRFSLERSRWVADERWHPQQIGQFQMDGTYELRIPYCESHELLMDILRHGAHVEVVSPDSLRAAITQALQSALARYLT